MYFLEQAGAALNAGLIMEGERLCRKALCRQYAAYEGENLISFRRLTVCEVKNISEGVNAVMLQWTVPLAVIIILFVASLNCTSRSMIALPVSLQ